MKKNLLFIKWVLDKGLLHVIYYCMLSSCIQYIFYIINRTVSSTSFNVNKRWFLQPAGIKHKKRDIDCLRIGCRSSNASRTPLYPLPCKTSLRLTLGIRWNGQSSILCMLRDHLEWWSLSSIKFLLTSVCECQGWATEWNAKFRLIHVSHYTKYTLLTTH